MIPGNRRRYSMNSANQDGHYETHEIVIFVPQTHQASDNDRGLNREHFHSTPTYSTSTLSFFSYLSFSDTHLQYDQLHFTYSRSLSGIAHKSVRVKNG